VLTIRAKQGVVRANRNARNRSFGHLGEGAKGQGYGIRDYVDLIEEMEGEEDIFELELFSGDRDLQGGHGKNGR